MGIFNKISDFFKREIELNKEYYENLEKETEPDPPQVATERPKLEVRKQVIEVNNNTLFQPMDNCIYLVYEFGHLFKIYPVPTCPYSYYVNIVQDAAFIISEGVQYDLSCKEAILSIAIPEYEVHLKSKIDKEMGSASALEFALREKGDKYWRQMEYDLAIACYGKATQLMAVSDEYWEDEDLYLIVRKLEELGRTTHADKWRIWLDRNYFSLSKEDYVEDIELLRKLDPPVAKKETGDINENKVKPHKPLIKLPRTMPKNKNGLSVAYSCGHIIKISTMPVLGDNYYDVLDQLRDITYIVSDGEQYNLTSIKSVISISVREYTPPEQPTFQNSFDSLEYLLMEKASRHDLPDDLKIACLKKAVELMKISDVEWDRQEYERIVWSFNVLGAKTDADELEKWYKKNVLTDEQEAELIVAGKITKELSYVQKEIIMVKRVTTEDMMRLSNMPYQLDCPIKKHIEHGSHPFAYMDLTIFNQSVAKKELSRLDEYIIQARNYIPLLTKEYHIDVKKIVFCDYDHIYGYTRLMCTPYTFTGKRSKYPLFLYFMSKGDIRTYSVNGELYYNLDGSFGKASVNIWKAPANYKHPGTGWTFTFETFDSEFTLSVASTTLRSDEYGRPTPVYRCNHIIKKENERELNKAIYQWFQAHLPDDCPKSFSGFSRMRNANSKNYQALVKKAEAAGFVFPKTLEEISTWEDEKWWI